MTREEWDKLVAAVGHRGENAPVVSRAGRWQDDVIERIVAEGSTVLDLGCGGGQLLARLVARRHVRAQGIEVDPGMGFEAGERGGNVFLKDLGNGLKGCGGGAFYYVVLEVALEGLGA